MDSGYMTDAIRLANSFMSLLRTDVRYLSPVVLARAPIMHVKQSLLIWVIIEVISISSRAEEAAALLQPKASLGMVLHRED
jgi:hypothetical protein